MVYYCRIGGGACILGEYTTRATLDIDFVDLGYPAKYGKVFVLLRDYDMLEYQSTILSPNYKERATKLEEFKYINVYILSKEDVAVSKIIRLAEKDIEDLNQIIPKCDKKILNNVIEEVLNREDLFDSKKNEFVKKLKTFREKYNGDNYRLQISKPFELLVDIDKYNKEQKKQSELYKKLCDLMEFMKNNVKRFPKLKAFLWTLDSRNIRAQKYGVSKEEDLEEQTKLVNSFLKLAYWY